jgi:hypothetical protein
MTLGWPSTFCLVVLFHSPSALAAVDTLTPQVDKRVELLSIVYRLANTPDFTQAPASAYLQAVDKHFGRYARHPLIQYVRAMNDRLRQDNVEVGAWDVFSLAVHLRDVSTPDSLVSATDSAIADNWDSSLLLKPALPALLRQFHTDAQCEKFFRSQENYYAAVNRAMAKLATHPNKAWLTAFFGLQTTENYRPVLSLFGVGDYSYMRVNFAGNVRDTYTVVAWKSFDKNGMPLALDAQKLARSTLHETIHSYTNQLVDRHMNDLRASAEVLLRNPTVWERVKDSFFNNAPFLLYESLVRASSIKYLLDNKTLATTREKEIAAQEKAGFLWIKGLVEQLDVYEQKRSQYKNLQEFMPELTKYFASVAAAPKAG